MVFLFNLSDFLTIQKVVWICLLHCAGISELKGRFHSSLIDAKSRLRDSSGDLRQIIGTEAFVLPGAIVLALKGEKAFRIFVDRLILTLQRDSFKRPVHGTDDFIGGIFDDLQIRQEVRLIS